MRGAELARTTPAIAELLARRAGEPAAEEARDRVAALLAELGFEPRAADGGVNIDLTRARCRRPRAPTRTSSAACTSASCAALCGRWAPRGRGPSSSLLRTRRLSPVADRRGPGGCDARRPPVSALSDAPGACSAGATRGARRPVRAAGAHAGSGRCAICVLAGRLRRALPARFGFTVRYDVTAACFPPAGAGLGTLLARGPADPLDAQVKLAHAAINVLGWMGPTVAGTVVTLRPTMVRTRIADDSEAAGRRLPASSATWPGSPSSPGCSSTPRVADRRRRSLPGPSPRAFLWRVGVAVLAAAVGTAPTRAAADDRFGRVTPFLAAGFGARRTPACGCTTARRCRCRPASRTGCSAPSSSSRPGWGRWSAPTRWFGPGCVSAREADRWTSRSFRPSGRTPWCSTGTRTGTTVRRSPRAPAIWCGPGCSTPARTARPRSMSGPARWRWGRPRVASWRRRPPRSVATRSCRAP